MIIRLHFVVTLYEFKLDYYSSQKDDKLMTYRISFVAVHSSYIPVKLVTGD